MSGETSAKAYFKALPPGDGQAFDVHFNPASLQYTLSNSLKDESSGGGRGKQYVDKTTAKLTLQLVYDTTDTGDDVRNHTERVARLLRPLPEGDRKVPPNVEFGWGVYRFTGMIEQYKETIDFFSASGVPLRASIDLTLADQDVRFDSTGNPSPPADRDRAREPAVLPAPAGGAAGMANALGAPRAARAIAGANGAASLRFGAQAGMAVGGGVQIKAEAAFSTGASASVGAGLGMGAGAGAGIGIGGGFGIGAGTGAGVGTAGISAGAGIGIDGAAAAQGAFAGLRAPAVPPLKLPAPGAVVAAGGDGVGRAGVGSSFDVTGKAQARTTSSLGADVGAGVDINALIRFG